jgi:hypothetical protein
MSQTNNRKNQAAKVWLEANNAIRDRAIKSLGDEADNYYRVQTMYRVPHKQAGILGIALLLGTPDGFLRAILHADVLRRTSARWARSNAAYAQADTAVHQHLAEAGATSLNREGSALLWYYGIRRHYAEAARAYPDLEQLRELLRRDALQARFAKTSNSYQALAMGAYRRYADLGAIDALRGEIYDQTGLWRGRTFVSRGYPSTEANCSKETAAWLNWSASARYALEIVPGCWLASIVQERDSGRQSLEIRSVHELEVDQSHGVTRYLLP